MENSSEVPCQIKIELPYNLAISLLGVYLKKTKMLIWEDICTLMFIAALFTIAKIWKQPKRLSIERWIKKIWCTYIHLYNRILPSCKNWNLAICKNMDGSRGYYTKENKSDRERQILHDLTYVWNLKNKTKQKQTHRYREQTGGCPRGGGQED